MSHEQNVPQQHNTPPFPQTGPEVNIIINAAPKEIHRGHRTVIELKDVGGIPQADELSNYRRQARSAGGRWRHDHQRRRGVRQSSKNRRIIIEVIYGIRPGRDR